MHFAIPIDRRFRPITKASVRTLNQAASLRRPKDSIWTFELSHSKTSRNELRSNLIKAGLENHNIVATDSTISVSVLDAGTQLTRNVETICDKYDVNLSRTQTARKHFRAAMRRRDSLKPSIESTQEVKGTSRIICVRAKDAIVAPSKIEPLKPPRRRRKTPLIDVTEEDWKWVNHGHGGF